MREKKEIIVCSSGIDVNDEEDEDGGLITEPLFQQPFQEDYTHMYTQEHQYI